MDDAYSQSIMIHAPPERVFRYFVDPAAIVRWMGDAADVEAQPGGRFSLRFGDRVVVGHYQVVDPPHRIVITWGRKGSPGFPPGSSTLEVTFSPDTRGTLVSIVHSGLPPAERTRHALGWRHYVTRLKNVSEGRPVARHHVPDTLTDGVDAPE